jgi:hypothetical protein
MDLGKASLVICLTLGAVVVVNLLIYFTLRRGVKLRELDLMRKITISSRQPFRKEQEELEELSKLVDGLRTSAEKDNREENE